MDPFYGGVIWTNHALERAKERNLTQQEILDSIKNFSTSYNGKTHKSIKYTRVSHDKMVEVIVKYNDKNELIILSCWSRPKSKFKPKIPFWEIVIRWISRLLFSKK